MKIDIVKKNKNAILPKKMTDGSAGWDIFACIDKEIKIKAGETVKIPSGVAISLPSNEVVALLFARSGLASKHGVTLANCVGVIDSDFRGEIQVALYNNSQVDYTIEPNERIAQLVFMPVFSAELHLCEQLDDTSRAEGGFGSTGI